MATEYPVATYPPDLLKAFIAVTQCIAVVNWSNSDSNNQKQHHSQNQNRNQAMRRGGRQGQQNENTAKNSLMEVVGLLSSVHTGGEASTSCALYAPSEYHLQLASGIAGLFDLPLYSDGLRCAGTASKDAMRQLFIGFASAAVQCIKNSEWYNNWGPLGYNKVSLCYYGKMY